ncbi:Metallo-dependent phosphatase-like protein [Trametes polyzona]|nr:Metallo-dependent phosphatase-like protein [Trametes polyzona]
MLELKALLLVLLALAPGSTSIPAQAPFEISSGIANAKPRRKLQGRFLHITDIHPDPHYRVASSEKKACHRGKPKEGKRPAGYYGLPFSDCDAPFSLTNYTLDFLDREWADEIDFVIWTGDSARHDNDRRHPRTTAEIYDLNRAMAKKMEHVFVRRGIPVVPSIGNNDVWPHNIMLPGPNSITAEFTSIWRTFVPFPSYQVFQRGGYFAVEVIPDSVAVISLNTMYFYDSNTAVGGCARSDREDPGNLQFDWLEVQLRMFRARGMQVWLSGHVPPSSRNFYSECYVRYLELSLRFQDTILGHVYGHMNMDHFFLLDAEQLASRAPRSSDMSLAGDDEAPPSVLKHKKKELYKLLLQEFADLPSANALNHDNYAVVNVAPSVIPTYLPSFRIYAYNTTGELYRAGQLGDAEAQPGPSRSLKTVVGDLCEEEEYENTWRCNLDQPWHSNPDAPSRTNRLWTPLGYAQYTLRDMDTADEEHAPKFKLEYLTFPVAALHPPPESEAAADATDTDDSARSEGKGKGKKKDKFWYPIPRRQLPRLLRNSTIEKSKKFAPYELEDLTIPSWTALAQRLGRAKAKRLRQRFRRFMYMGADEAR